MVSTLQSVCTERGLASQATAIPPVWLTSTGVMATWTVPGLRTRRTVVTVRPYIPSNSITHTSYSRCFVKPHPHNNSPSYSKCFVKPHPHNTVHLIADFFLEFNPHNNSPSYSRCYF